MDGTYEGKQEKKRRESAMCYSVGLEGESLTTGRESRGKVGDKGCPRTNRTLRTRQRSHVLIEVSRWAAPKDGEQSGSSSSQTVARQDESIGGVVLEGLANSGGSGGEPGGQTSVTVSRTASTYVS